MKRFTFSIEPWNSDLIFSPVRTKKDIIVLLMKVIKIMDVGPSLAAPPEDEYFELVISHTSRLFFYSEDKHFSIGFPFNATMENEQLIFKSLSGVAIDSQMTSDILGVMASEAVFHYEDIIDFASPVSDYFTYNKGGWSILRELLMAEDGYIRYDHDPVHVKGDIHPLHHLDVFYGTRQTFKIGLTTKIDRRHLHDALDSQTPCHYLNPRK
ncbi:hypothetical protein [Pseudomonas sp. CMR5c]|uniref:hypothetical protein n=1 Tax=Pseudomonas sp. CMR5c TaxID=658630 RepID=UPI000A63F9B5|nr:hypothetical protein [Pseudomonas sp. CMR5c]AZC15600.1 hypothetical protein C4K40_0175 [Pseudomonas sp. CMR5c]